MSSQSVVHRPRKSPWEAVSVEEAYETIFDHGPERRIETVDLADLRTGDVIAESIVADEPIPRFRTSRMDGYAVKASDGVGRFRVLGAIAAGASAKDLRMPCQHCFRINTGGVVPDQADAVVPVELTRLVEHNDVEEIVIEVTEPATAGQHIREVGADVGRGQVLLEVGERLGAAEVALLAAVGRPRVRRWARPRLGVLSSGDELVDQAAALAQGHIPDSNRPMLVELARHAGFRCVDGGIVRDDPGLLKQRIEELCANCDIIVLSGGVSMGDKDLLKSVLQQDLGLRIHFGRVRMKPGLPNTFAAGRVRGAARVVLGLPGNPASAFVSAHLFLLPLLRHVSGRERSDSLPRKLPARLCAPHRLDARPEYVRAVLHVDERGQNWARVVSPDQLSSRILSLKQANVLLELPARSESKAQIDESELVTALVIGPVY